MLENKQVKENIMAKSNEESFNSFVADHLSSIDDDKLARIADAVARFTSNYNNYVKTQQQAEKKNEVVKEIKASEKNRKADAVKNENYLKRMAENSNVQSKTLTKILEESLDSKSAQETLQKIQESALSSNKAMNQDIIKGLSELAASSAENAKTSDKLYSLTEDMQKENAQARLQSLLKDTKRFRLESNYWKSLTGNIKKLSSEFHDFKNNPSAWMAEAMGDMLGKALDKSIDGVKETLSAGLKSITDGLSGLKNSIFDMMADQKKRAEGLAQEFNRSYLEASGALGKSNLAVSRLAQTGELDISRTSKNVDTITSKLLRRFGDDLAGMEQDVYEKHFKAYAQLINAGAADKIDEIEEIAGGNEKLMEEMIKTETQLAGIRSRQDLRIQKGMDAAIMTAEEAHKLGMTYEQSIRANEKNQIFVAKVLSSNKELGVEEIKAFTALQKTLMSQDFVTNILDDKNVNLSQLIGLDANQVKKILSSGSDKDRLDFMNRVVQSGAYNEIPALKRMMEDLGFDAQSLNVLSKQGGLKIDDDSIKKITDAQNKDFSEINDVLLSSGSKINEEIRTRISILSAEGIRNKDKSFTKAGEIQLEALKEFNTLEKIIREESLETKEQKQNAKELYNLIKDYSDGNQEAIEKFSNLSDSDKELAEKILIASDKSEKLVKDQIQISETLSDAQDLGLDKALSGGGLSGLFSGLLDVGLKSAYSPEYQEKLSSFMDNIKKSIEPAVNVFKELLIDPIIDSLKNNIGMLLGDILVGVKGIWRNMTKSEYSDEEKILDKYRFVREGFGDISTDRKKIASGASGFSDEYKNAIKNIDKMSLSDISNLKGVSEKERAKLQIHKATNSEVMNTGGKVVGIDEITKLDYMDNNTQRQIQNLLKKSDITLVQNSKGKYTDTVGNASLNDLVTLINESDDSTGRTASKFLGLDPDVNESEIFKLMEALYKKGFGNQVGNFYDLFGVDKSFVWNPKDMLVLGSYFLLKKNLDIGARRYPNNYNLFNYELFDHNKESNSHILINNKPVEYANGGIVAATAGGKQVTVGEAGHDEIILPTDPAKQARAQYLLQQAQEKYGLYANNPDEASAKLKEQMSELLFDLRILMIQLDPMRDITAMRSVMSAFGLLKNASVIANPDAATDANQPEELIGEGLPKLGEPIKDAANLGSIRAAIINEAKKYTGTPYALAPAGLVCNQLVNAAYAGVLGKKNYAEMLRTLGYAHDEMHTISGFIPEIRKGSSDKVLLASSVEYSSLSSLAKPGDLVFSSNTGKTPNGLNPDNHGHVNLFIDKDSKIDSTSMKINGKDGVGVHKPYKGKHMLMNLLDNMPESWYVEKGLLKPDSSSERNIIGLNADGTPIYANNANMSSYDPALQSTPNASYVSDQVNRADQAKIEKERRNAEKQNRTAVEQIREVINNLGIKMTHMDMQRQMSVSVPPDKTFCTSGMSSSSGMCYSIG